MRDLQTSVDRHVGFNNPLVGNDIIEIVESVDTFSMDEPTNTAILDAFTAYPDLNAIYIQAAGINGCIEALRTIGRLYPVGDPEHIVIAVNDTETGSVRAMRDGYLDAFGTHTCRTLGDVTVKLMLNHTLLGESIPKEAPVPMKLVTTDNLDTIEVLRGTPIWPDLPPGDWAKWPVLDSSELGVPTPTVNMRKALLDY
jgi:ABC-type sugar transport system substrate-binding protein